SETHECAESTTWCVGFWRSAVSTLVPDPLSPQMATRRGLPLALDSSQHFVEFLFVMIELAVSLS
ncbi:MAG: hypothetical protein ACRD4O_14115, partial [Bryobacteraceae bacterium]